MAELYDRHEGLNLQGLEMNVAIVGCGGVGVWAAMAIALGGVNALTLYDGDDISLTNLNRLPFSTKQLGDSKSVALAMMLQELRPDLHVAARGAFDPALHDFDPIDYVVCCTDSLKSRKMVYEAAKKHSFVKYLELGADEERWTLSGCPPLFTTELEAEPGYATVPVHVGPCMMAGAAAAYYVLHNVEPTSDHLVEWQRETDREEGCPAGLKLLTIGDVEQGEDEDGDETDSGNGEGEGDGEGEIEG